MRNKKSLFILFITAILAGSIAVAAVILINLNGTVENVAKNTINKTTEKATAELDEYFKTILANLHIGKELCDNGTLDALQHQNVNKTVLPFFNNIPQLNSIAIADTAGNQFTIIREDSTWLNSIVYKSQDSGMVVKRKRWHGNCSKKQVLETKTIYHSDYDPRNRPWFKGAINNDSTQIAFWTQPYLFFTLQVPGITISLKSYCELTQRVQVIEYDILISHISKFTIENKVSESGKTFILSNNLKVIGLPNEKYLNSIDSIQKYMLKDYDSVKSKALELAVDKWRINPENHAEPFHFELDGKVWWARITKYELGANNYFIIGVVVPEKDFLDEINTTRNIVIGGFLIILLFVVIVINQYIKKRKANILLTKQQKQITDSILYAEKIQRALLPSTNILEKHLDEYFILYRPLHIVSGDFYWIKKVKHYILIVAADCTGHGVPGAFVSMLGLSFLNEIAQNRDVWQSEKSASQILDLLRDKVKTAFRQKGNRTARKDGMDMTLCIIDTNSKVLQFSGAFNPLYIVRKSELPKIETKHRNWKNNNYTLSQFKGDKMPIGIHRYEKPFTNHQVKLMKGDTLYMFSDGFYDQFGGENNRKFMVRNFRKLLLSVQNENMEQQKSILNETYNKWKGDKYKQLDDVLVLGIRI